VANLKRRRPLQDHVLDRCMQYPSFADWQGKSDAVRQLDLGRKGDFRIRFFVLYFCLDYFACRNLFLTGLEEMDRDVVSAFLHIVQHRPPLLHLLQRNCCDETVLNSRLGVPLLSGFGSWFPQLLRTKNKVERLSKHQVDM
jgi:hypothetical protein